jgi:CheY-like chemotaxis protein
MATILDKASQSTAFTREEIEHAHTSVKRLRERLRTLATISASNIASDRVSRMTSEATTHLNVIGCVIQSTRGENEEGRYFLHHQNGVPPDRMKSLAANLNSKVISAGSSIIIQNLRQQCPHESWLLEHDVHSYMGVPIFGSDRLVSAVAAVFGGRNRAFGDEDDWWLRTAGQMVSDSLACEMLEGKLRDLERIIDPSLADESTGENEAAARKPAILVIDDDRTINEVICESLTMDGYQVEAAFNGVEAIQAFQPAKHDLVISDVAMPLMNGWELIAALRVRSPTLPIILISGYQTGEWNQSYLTKQGVSAVLNKPLRLGQLSALVAKLIPLTNVCAPG